jgi:hypothetical protein
MTCKLHGDKNDNRNFPEQLVLAEGRSPCSIILIRHCEQALRLRRPKTAAPLSAEKRDDMT